MNNIYETFRTLDETNTHNSNNNFLDNEKYDILNRNELITVRFIINKY